MSTSTQLQRSMAVATPLPFDTLLLLGFTGEEGISRLFHFQLDLAAPNASAVAFEALLGRPVSIRLALPGGSARFISGICSRLSQGTRSTEYTTFGMEVVPAAWVLTRRARSRIRQGASVPDILREVFQEIPDVTFELRGRYAPRDYCVQYRETDFNFASRLMEEEGIYYYFRHEAGAHHMIVSDRQEFPALQPGALVLQPLGESILTENRITHWEKSQRLGSTKVTLHDHTFELPHQKLAAEAWVQESVTVGRASHKLRVGKSSALEIYDWPGEYAQRFDGIDRGGHDRPADLQEIYQDNLRTAQLRAQEEAAAAITIRGAGRYRHLCSGHTFTITERSPETYANTPVHDGQYVLTSVSHVGRVGESYRSGGQDDDLY
ncbi:MAG: type VI secretion system Vgr family protein, partial [Isosphaeraceae bacterium]